MSLLGKFYKTHLTTTRHNIINMKKLKKRHKLFTWNKNRNLKERDIDV